MYGDINTKNEKLADVDLLDDIVLKDAEEFHILTDGQVNCTCI